MRASPSNRRDELCDLPGWPDISFEIIDSFGLERLEMHQPMSVTFMPHLSKNHPLPGNETPATSLAMKDRQILAIQKQRPQANAPCGLSSE